MTDLELLGELTIDHAAGIITPPAPGHTPRTITSLDDLRETVRTDDLGRYRPLSGARTLPSGWRFLATPTATLDDAIDVIYPLARVHINQLAAGTLRIVTLDDVFARQLGRYRVAAELSPENRTLATATLCSTCIRTPLWPSDVDPSSPLSSSGGRGGQGVRDGLRVSREPDRAAADAPVLVPPASTVPCPEPCSVLLSLCREAAIWQTQLPTPAPPSSAVPFAAFETPGNELRERCLSLLAGLPGVEQRTTNNG